jgi:hypothetical protein
VLKITKTTSNRNNVVDCPSFAPVIWWASDLAAAIITTVRDAVPGSAAERDLQMIHQATGYVIHYFGVPNRLLVGWLLCPTD